MRCQYEREEIATRQQMVDRFEPPGAKRGKTPVAARREAPSNFRFHPRGTSFGRIADCELG
jgi:hypothetical protein